MTNHRGSAWAAAILQWELSTVVSIRRASHKLARYLRTATTPILKRSMTDPSTPEAVQVARITARQAVVVAIISCFGGVAAALIGSGFFKDTANTNPPESQHAVRVAGVDLHLDGVGRPEKELRIIAMVNESAKAYPTDGAWSPPNPDLTFDPFFIPAAEEYSIRFEVFAKDTSGTITRFTAVSAHKIAVAQLPALNKSIELHEEGSGGWVRGVVRFSVQ